MSEKKVITVNNAEVDTSSKESFTNLDAVTIQDIKTRFGADPHGEVEDPISEFLFKEFLSMSIEEALDILAKAIEYHNDDVNFPSDIYEKIELIVQGPEAYAADIEVYEREAKVEATLIHYHSPYPEVRAVTDPFDDPEIPVETIRAYFWGFLWTIIGTGMNQFFSPRQPSISLSSGVLQIILLPCGRVSEYLPDWGFTFRGTRHSLNPGPWSFKEQMFATIIFSVSIGGAYAGSYNIFVDKLEMYYGSAWADVGYQFLLVLSTQFVGFGFAGVMRRLIVYPVRAMWPTMLPTIAMNRALASPETKKNLNGWTISRYRFFVIVFCASFLYFWIPNYLFAGLSYFNWITWIKPDNFNLAVITGSIGGLGLNPLPTFDWSVINYSAPLNLPFYSQVNQFIGVVISGLILIPAVFYTNYKWTGYLPVNSNAIFHNTGERYNVTKVLTGGLLDPKKYAVYGPPFYTAANLVVYGSFFAIYPFAIIYTFVTDWKAISASVKDLWKSVRNPKRSNFDAHDDVHSKMMSKYKETPDWYFLVVLVIALVLGIVLVKVYPGTETPVWGLFFTIGINFIFLIPITLIYSVTGFSFGLNVLVELIVGYAIPGNGNALNILKCYGYNIDGQAQNYITDQKMGHYSKIPPLALFRGQMISTIFQCLVTIGVVNWQISNIEGLCTKEQAQKFTCPGVNTFFSASVLWGVIGPKKVFGGLYPILQWCFLIGALAPIPCLLAKRYFPKTTRYFQPTLIIGGLFSYAPYNLTYHTVGMYISWGFMHHIRRRYLAWWEKYTYVLSASLTAGVAFSAIIIFFAVQYHPKDINWWGNNVPYNGLDASMGGRLDIPEDPGYFGPSPENFP
ncbi:hypothetical protein DV495_005157 [Geotrichum candidum]|nr:hypothetical protein DV495_005157 [Geotrichum candidum]